MFDVGSGEVILILVVALLLFGGRLPEVARAVGRAIAAVRKGVRDGMEPVREPLRDLKSDMSRELRETGESDDS
ncbi:MAG: Sec-independent protein translocase subunit TatA/TatB [Planctomycetota bacterium]|jgi:TatA/E family protein of Tat protein translocase